MVSDPSRASLGLLFWLIQPPTTKKNFKQPFPGKDGYYVKIPGPTTCKSGPGVVYHISCKSGKDHCRLAHYVGRAWTSDNSKYPMPLRWSNHKSHHKMNVDKCQLTDHLIKYHKEEDPQLFLKIQILKQANTLEDTLSLESWWRRRLFSFRPTGLNVREDVVM